MSKILSFREKKPVSDTAAAKEAKHREMIDKAREHVINQAQYICELPNGAVKIHDIDELRRRGKELARINRLDPKDIEL